MEFANGCSSQVNIDLPACFRFLAISCFIRLETTALGVEPDTSIQRRENKSMLPMNLRSSRCSRKYRFVAKAVCRMIGCLTQ